MSGEESRRLVPFTPNPTSGQRQQRPGPRSPGPADYLAGLHGRTSTAAERQPYARAYWDQADPDHASPGAESFTGLLRRTAGFLGRLSAQRSGPVVVFTHGLFMRAVAWSLLTGITTPGQDQMRSFRRFANHYLIPNAGIIELRQVGNDTPALGGSTIHLPAALTPRPR